MLKPAKARAFLYRKWLLTFLLLLSILLASLFCFQDFLQADNEGAVMVVVENHPASRPQAGLNQADIVYEFLVEGGMTRFLAGYFTSLPDKTGPIRSLRPYMIEVAAQHEVPVFHIGASSDALQLAEENNFPAVDEIAYQQYFWRYDGRSRPHNLYTDRSALERAFADRIIDAPVDNKIEAKNFWRDEFLNWDGKDNEVIWNNGVETEKFSLEYWSNKIEYIYHEQEEVYNRYIADSPHFVEDEEVIGVKNLIVMFVPHKIVDEEGRLKIDFSGQGRAKFLSQGKLIKGEWQNNYEGENLEFNYYVDMDEKISFPPGLTWVQVVPTTTTVDY